MVGEHNAKVGGCVVEATKEGITLTGRSRERTFELGQNRTLLLSPIGQGHAIHPATICRPLSDSTTRPGRSARNRGAIDRAITPRSCHDNDELTDGDEVNTYGTNPANADSDGDELNDGDEVFDYGTDPNDADTDNDGLRDGIEVKYGTNPRVRDSDGDGLLDGQDVEWIQNAIAGIPDTAIKPPGGGNRNAMLNLLEDAGALLLKGSKGNRKAALDKLMTLRSRLDGCGAVPDGNDLDRRLCDPGGDPHAG